jgi:hypothetical protein
MVPPRRQRLAQSTFVMSGLGAMLIVYAIVDLSGVNFTVPVRHE